MAAAGARHISPLVLHLRPGAREWYFGWLETHHPTLVARYRELYGHGSYAPRSYCDEVTGRVHALATTLGMTPRSPTRGPSATRRLQVRPPPTERTDAGQLSLL